MFVYYIFLANNFVVSGSGCFESVVRFSLQAENLMFTNFDWPELPQQHKQTYVAGRLQRCAKFVCFYRATLQMSPEIWTLQNDIELTRSDSLWCSFS